MKENQPAPHHLEQLERLLHHPHTVTPEELEAWSNDEAFMQLYTTAMDAQRALHAHGTQPDAKAAFAAFRQKHIHPQADSVQTAGSNAPKHNNFRSLWLAAAGLAACVLVVLSLQLGGVFKQSEPPIEVYRAQIDPTDILLTIGTDSIPLAIEQAMADTLAPVSRQTSAAPRHEEVVSVLHTLIIPSGKRFQLTLSDGTQVWLNADSKFTYPQHFTGDTRTVQLEGEAYFEVAKDASHPFVVESNGLHTQVLGTHFNVRNYEGEQPHITLVEGSVSVSHQAQQVVLHPGEDATLTNHATLTALTINTELYTCWRMGNFYFHNAPLQYIMTEIGRRFGLSVVFNQPQRLGDILHLHADSSWSIHDFIEQIALISDAHIRLEGETLVVE